MIWNIHPFIEQTVCFQFSSFLCSHSTDYTKLRSHSVFSDNNLVVLLRTFYVMKNIKNSKQLDGV